MLTDMQRDVLLAVARNTRMLGLVAQFGESAYDTIGELCDARLVHGYGMDMGGNHAYLFGHNGRAALRECGVPDEAWQAGWEARVAADGLREGEQG